MKKLLTLFLLALTAARSTNAQLSAPLLDRANIAFQDLSLAPDQSILFALRFDNAGFTQRVELRNFTDSSFGTIQFSVPIDADAYWMRLEAKDSVVYALGEYIQPVHVLSPSNAVVHPKNRLCRNLLEYARWNDMLYTLSLDSTFVQRLYIHSLANPFTPQAIDTVDMSLYSGMTHQGDRLYFARQDSQGLRIVSYTLSATPPYLVQDQTFWINSVAPPVVYVAGMDILGNRMVLKTADSLYMLAPGAGGLQMLSRHVQYGPGVPTLMDSTIVAYRGLTIQVHDLLTDSVFVADSLNAFDGYLVSKKLGSNYFYATSLRSDLRKIVRVTGTSVGTAPAADRILTYPNPASDCWHVQNGSGEALNLRVFSATGALVMNRVVEAGMQTIPLSSLNPGLYYYYLFRGTEPAAKGRLLKNQN